MAEDHRVVAKGAAAANSERVVRFPAKGTWADPARMFPEKDAYLEKIL
jgi:hypothetical protein